MTLPPPDRPALRVLASGSAGNCSVLVVPSATGDDAGGAGPARVVLIDAGLSPRKTETLLADSGIGLEDVSDILLTHLAHDHAHTGWARPAVAPNATLRIHRAHMGRARRAGLLHRRTEPMDDGPNEIARTLTADTARMAHDDLGVCVFRLRLDQVGCDIGFATDLGRPTEALIDHLTGVDVLAIESNYCPDMQESSDRPAFLKRRIMGGAGHLSNEEAAEAVDRIGPREHVVFLHLSRDCNQPERVSALHEGADYAWTIASQSTPTRWIPITPSNARATPMPRLAAIGARQHALFGPRA